MKPFTAKLAAILFVAYITGSALAADTANDGDIEILNQGTKAEIIKEETPVYPDKALRRGIEGWVTLKFVVKADGTTDEIEVVESSIEGYFDDAAIKAARKRLYKPSSLQGKPIMQGNISLRSVFMITDSDGGVSKPFLKSYKRASTALDDGNLVLANDLIEELDGENKRLLAEVCYLDMLKARYYAELGNDVETLRYVERALVIADTVASKPIYINLLQQAIVDNGKANNFQASLMHYETLTKVDKSMAPDDPIHNYVLRINQVLESDADINIKGAIPASCQECTSSRRYWHHDLNRNRFSIDQVVGELRDIRILCQNSSITVAYEEQMAWNVEKETGTCSISVRGQSGTTFRLVELPNEG